MTDQSRNDVFHASSFMQGHNAAYLEQLQARYAEDPGSVDESWREFFDQLGADGDTAKHEAQGPSWARNDWPPQPQDDITHALDGNWPAAPEAQADGKAIAEKIAKKAGETGAGVTQEQIRAAVLDSVRALMLIRAYRIRGHLAADLDPLGLRDAP